MAKVGRNRACLPAALEVKPVYVHVAVRRWEAYAGREASMDGVGIFAEGEQEPGA